MNVFGIKANLQKVVICALVVITISSCKQPAKPKANDVLAGLLAKNKKHTSVSYHVALSLKPPGVDVARNYSVRCKLIKNAKDTLFNGYVWVSSRIGHYTYERYYNLSKIYEMNDSLKTVTVYPNPATQYWGITGNAASAKSIDIFFLDTTEIQSVLKDTARHNTFTIDTVNGATCYNVLVKYKNTDQISDKYKHFWITTKDSTLVQMKSHFVYQNSVSTSEWRIDSIEFDKVKPEDLQPELTAKLASYEVKNYAEPDTKTLANGTQAPDFEGTDFASGKKVSLDSYKGKLLLVDFWYINCQWCMKAMPGIEKIGAEFKDKGLTIIGMNSTDNNDNGKKRLPDCITRNKIDYSVVLTQHKTDSLYRVFGYPTVYLIDKKGTILYSLIGYEDNGDSLITAEVKKALR